MKECNNFLKEIIDLRTKCNFELKNIINCDETTVCLNNLENKTVIKKELKQSIVKL